MREDSDFAAYVSARWPTLVRTLVLLGATREEAEAAARTGLARCRSSWRQICSGADPEVDVHRAVLAAWADRASGWWAVPAADPAPELAALEPRLDRLTVAQRAALALRVAGLDETQVADVLDVRPAARRPGHALPDDLPDDEDLRAAAETVETLPPPIEAFAAEAAGHDPGRRRRVGTALAVAVALVGTATWAGTRPDAAAEQPPPSVNRGENPAGIAWWANGQLHLAHVSIGVPRVTDLVEVDKGAVFGDEGGRVLFANEDGTVSTIGRKEAQQPLVASDDTGWAAWVDPGGAAPRLVVYDVTAREVLSRRSLPADGDRFGPDESHPIALDRDTVYWSDQDGDWEWSPPDGEVAPVQGTGLIAVQRALTVWQIGPADLKFVQPFFSLAYARTGRGAQLSADATRLLTRKPVPGDEFGRVRIYDTRTGERMWTGLDRQDVVVAATMGPGQEASYVIAHREDLPRAGEFVRMSFSGPYELRTCDLTGRRCRVMMKFPHTGALPVLPR
jgi:hypothetical protein